MWFKKKKAVKMLFDNAEAWIEVNIVLDHENIYTVYKKELVAEDEEFIYIRQIVLRSVPKKDTKENMDSLIIIRKKYIKALIFFSRRPEYMFNENVPKGSVINE